MPQDRHHHHAPAGGRGLVLAVVVNVRLTVAQIAGVIFSVSAALIRAFGWQWVDPVITLMNFVWFGLHAFVEIRPVIHIPMLAAPPEVEQDALRRAIEGEDGIAGAHHLHLRQMDERRVSAEAHPVVAEDADFGRIVRLVKARVERDFGIHHITLETVAQGSGCAGPVCPPNAA